MIINKKNMNVLVCAPKNITLTGFVDKAFKTIDANVEIFDAVQSSNILIRKSYFKTLGIKWINVLFKAFFIFAVNMRFKRKVSMKKYDLIFIYNSEYISPESLRFAKEKGVKLINYLGDNPFYTSIYAEGIRCLKYFDVILSPDAFWLKCLEMIDLRANLVFSLPGANPSFSNLGTADTPRLVFVGSNYTNKEGFKRAALFSSVSHKMHVYGGRSWRQWLTYFPDLKEVYFESGRMSDESLNVLINQYKLAIVDANTGIVAGVHQRFLDISQTGCLPLVEIRYELMDVLGDLKIVFRNPAELRELIDLYLNDEILRINTLKKLSNTISARFNVKSFISCLK